MRMIKNKINKKRKIAGDQRYINASFSFVSICVCMCGDRIKAKDIER